MYDNDQILSSKYFRYFCYCVLMELCLLGSGADLVIPGTPLTLRYANYLVGLGLSAVLYLRCEEFPKRILMFLLAFTIQIALAVMLSYVYDSPPDFVFEDLKPLTYFYMAFFFYFIFTSEDMMRKAYKILLLAVQIMTAFYLVYMLLTDILGIFSLERVYILDDLNNFMFRGVGSAFFYKGFIFLPIGAVGFFKDKRWVWFVLTSLAVYFTYTRGLYVMLGCGVLIYYLKSHAINIYKIVGVVLVIVLLYEVAEVMEIFHFDDTFVENRESSDLNRYLLIEQVFDDISSTSWLIGHGFGHGVAERTTHMEISYLDIFHHQGILGVAFWLLLLYFILRDGNMVADRYKPMADFYITAALMVYLQSCFNPYLNNPIGMSMVLQSFIICYRLSHDEVYLDSSSGV